MGGNNARLGRCTEHHRPRAVAPQDAIAAVIPIGNARQRFCTDHHDVPGCAAFDELIRHGQRVDKTTAHRLQVKRGLVIGHAQFSLHAARGAGKDQIRGSGRHQQQVDVIGLQPRCVKRGTRRLGGQITSEFTFGGDMPLMYPGAFNDPLRRGLDALFQVGVGKDASR